MCPASRSSEPFSNVDAAWLHMDKPTNLAMITAVMMLDRRLDFETVKDLIASRFCAYKRFRMRVRPPRGLGLGLPRWDLDPYFDINNHVHRIALPAPADQTALQDLAGDLMSTPLDLSRPLWQMHYIENYKDGSAIVSRLHHCIADGIALMRVLLSMADENPENLPPCADEGPDSLSLLARLFRPAVSAVYSARDTWYRAETLLQDGLEIAVHPSRVADMGRAGRDYTRALGKLLLLPPDRRTIFRGACGVPKRVAWSQPLDLDQVKAIGRTMGGTVNDVLLSAITGALRRYLEGRSERTRGLNIRAIVPVNLRQDEPLDKLGNRFGLVFLSLPVGVVDPIKRLVILKRRMDEIKNSPEAIVAIGILAGIGMSPQQIEDIVVKIFGVKGTAVMTNVPGPRQPLYMAGARMDDVMFWVPAPASLGMGVSILSYAGHVVVGVMTDAGLVSDPETIVQAFQDELEALSKWGRPPAAQPIPAPERQPIPVPAISEPAVSPNGYCQALTKTGQPCKNKALPGQPTCRVHAAELAPA